ncbi:hypothetical protein KRR38_16335 [Novosphingobium sp. G106]|uniref:hypothetical protein n=1 Tax=Novosphingobium sp. G106 TaxID=2849500 RepID=UPI001C2D9100|nr:hypothetical protein [Novosphingobium sp. G106]MBV1689199.1 hypothetical protein [Novosphingobium sp. G106]
MKSLAGFGPQLIGAARAEAERMRTAVAGAEATAKVNMEAGQFLRLAGLIAAVCDLASAPAPEKEKPMKANDPSRSLAQIESDMVAAEAAYAEAEERLKQAQQDRDAALASIDRHQSELDAAVSRLRQRSPAGSHWKGRAADAAAVLMLDHEDSSPEEAALLHPAEDAPAEPEDQGEGLKAGWERHGGDKVD